MNIEGMGLDFGFWTRNICINVGRMEELSPRNRKYKFWAAQNMEYLLIV